MVSAMVAVAIGVVSLLVGLVIGVWYSSLGKGAETKKAESIQEAFDDYKADVSNHFGETAKHFAAIGQEYRALYSHMAGSAEALLGADSDISQDSFPRIAAAAAAPETPQDETVTAPDDPSSEPIEVVADTQEVQPDEDAATADSDTAADGESRDNESAATQTADAATQDNKKAPDA